MTIENRALGLLLSALAFGCSSCSIFSSSGDPVWVGSTVAVEDDAVFWRGVIAGIRSSGFPVVRSDAKTGVFESGWVFAPYQFSNDAIMRRESLRQPFRRKVHVEVAPLSRGMYNVRVRVERQRNTDDVDPSNELRADWTEDPDDVDKAREILVRIKNYRISSEST